MQEIIKKNIYIVSLWYLDVFYQWNLHNSLISAFVGKLLIITYYVIRKWKHVKINTFHLTTGSFVIIGLEIVVDKQDV